MHGISYHELDDPVQLLDRAAAENKLRATDGKFTLPETSWLADAMATGLPPSAGVALGVDDAVGHVVMGWTHEMAGAREASLASYRRALDLDPSQASPYYKLARAGAFEDLEAIAAQFGHPGNLGGETDAAGAMDAAGHIGLHQRSYIFISYYALAFCVA